MVRALAAIALLLVAATLASAGPLVVEVVTDDGTGRIVPVPGAPVAAMPAGGPVWAEEAAAAARRTTGPDGRAVVPSEDRAAGALCVVAGSPFRGFALAVAGPEADLVRVVLPGEAVAEGRVTDGAGRAVAGAAVSLWEERPEDGNAAVVADRLCFRAFSNGEGRFRVDRLARGARYRVTVRRAPHAPGERRDADPAAGPLDFVLGPGAAVSGLVLVVPGGTPLAGAEVSAGGITIRTGADGTFRLRGLPPGTVRLAVAAPGVSAVDEPLLALAAGEERQGVTVRVRAAGRMRGRVLGPGTEAAAGAAVWLRWPPDPDDPASGRFVPVATCDAQGRFETGDLRPARGVDLLVRHPAYAPAVHYGYSLLPGAAVEAVVLLRAGAVLRGRVVASETGEGVPGAIVEVVEDREAVARAAGPPEPASTGVVAVCGEDGTFCAERVGAGRKAVLARADGRPTGMLRGVDVSEGTAREGLIVGLGEGARIEGVVRGENGRPVAAATVAAEGETGRTAEGRTDAAGGFRLAGLPAGRYRLTVTAEGYPSPEPVAIAAPASGVAIALVRGGVLTGSVVEGGTGIVGARVRVSRRVRDGADGWTPPFRVVAEKRTVAADGTFRFEGLPEGPFRVEAWTEDGRYGVRDQAAAAADAPLVVEVEAGWTVEGRVVRAADGTPVEAATIAVRGAADRPPPVGATSGADGSFRLSGVAAGLVDVLVTAEGLSPRMVRGVEVREASDNRVGDVALTAGATVRGTVTDEAGQPQAGVVVALRSRDLHLALSAPTDSDGRFEFFRVAPGAWLAAVTDVAGGLRQERLFSVPAEGEVDVALGTGGGCRLEGRVLSGGECVPGARITALSLSGDFREERVVVEAVADEDGQYVLAGLPAGEVLLEVEVPGAGTGGVHLRVRVSPGPVCREDLVLPDSGIAGRVEGQDDGEGVPGAEVALFPDAGAAADLPLARAGGATASVRSGPDGRFRFAHVPPGAWRLLAFREGFGQAGAAGVRVAPGGDTPVRIVLPRAGVLTVRVLDDRGRPAPGGRVAVLDASGAPATSPPVLLCDADGECRIGSLCAGVYTVRAEGDGLGRIERGGVEVFPGGRAEVEVRLAGEGRLVVAVAGPGGRPLAGARVSVRDFWGRAVAFPPAAGDPRSPWRVPDETGEDGTLTLSGLAPGLYEVTAAYPGLDGKPARVRVAEGETARGSVVLLPPVPPGADSGEPPRPGSVRSGDGGG